jgi:thiamine-monophosphate kinase
MTAVRDPEIGGEFELIRQFFTNPSQHAQVDLAVGDDAALFRIAEGQQCVVTSDLLVSGRHFFADVAPRDLGHKALAVNLSDLAAMGAEPVGFTLSLALPDVDANWLSEFSAGLLALACEYNCDLIGGDTTRSELLVINITAFGQVPMGAGIRRDGAQAGDDVWISGHLGEAAYALDLMRNALQPSILSEIRHRLERPIPRVKLGLALRGVASAMLDLSDGLASDLLHILKASDLSATIDADTLPLSTALLCLPTEQAWRYALTGGDDYELCFTAHSNMRERIMAIAELQDIRLTRIGAIKRGSPKINWQSTNAPQLLDNMRQWMGYNHFPKGL